MESTDLQILRDGARGEWHLELAPDRVYVADGLVFEHDHVTLTVDKGALAPVFAVVGHHRVPVGYAFSGQAAAQVRFDDPHDATRFANHMVLSMGQSTARMKPVANGAPFTTEVDQALLLGASLASRWDSLPAARSMGAKEGLRDRLRTLGDPDPNTRGRLYDFTDYLAPQALLAAKAGLPTEVSEVWVDLRTQDRYGAVEDRRLPGALASDSWLTVHEEPSGAPWRGGLCGQILSLGRNTDGFPHSGRFAWLRCNEVARPSVTSTEMDVVTAWKPPGFTLDASVTTRLELQAGAGGLAALPIALDGLWETFEEHRWALEVRLEGGQRVDLPTSEEGQVLNAPPDVVWAVFPTPLAPGERATIEVRISDIWSFYNANYLDRGASTGVKTPSVAPAFLPWGFHGRSRLTVVAPTSVDGRYVVPITADPAGSTGQASRSTWERASGVGRPAFAVGEYAEPAERPQVTVNATRWVPAVKAWGLRRDGARLEGAVDAMQPILGWMSGFLPSLPVASVQAVFATSWFRGTAGQAPGVISIGAVDTSPNHWSLVDVDAGAQERALIRSLTRQIWGGLLRPASARDTNLVEAIAGLYTNLGVQNLIGEVPAEEWRRILVLDCEDPQDRFWHRSLTVPNGRSTVCAPYVLGRGLSARVGMEPLMRGLDRLATTRMGGTVSVEMIQEVLQGETTVDLGPFFDGWIHGGYVPALEASATAAADGSITGTVRSDVPFGRSEVPVSLTRGERVEYVWVVLVDGVGAFSFPAGPPARALTVDPGRWILARSRSAVLRPG